MKKKKEKEYTVNISLRYSHDIKVKAFTVWAAKTKACLKLLGMLRQKDFTFFVDLDE